MNLTQLWNTIVRGAIYRLMWRLPPWVLWAIVGLAFLMALSHGHAADMCDFEHHCYPGQTYHMDPAHPDRETPPPLPSYALPKPTPSQPQCHVVVIRLDGERDFTAAEVCTLSPEKEAQVRSEMRLSGQRLSAAPGWAYQ